MTYCRECGNEWTGKKTEHCPVCHETFTGSKAGDKHRTGDHALTEGPNRRRCRTPDEMRAKGMAQSAAGCWMATNQPMSADAVALRRNAARQRRAENLRHEQTPTHTQVPPEKSGP